MVVRGLGRVVFVVVGCRHEVRGAQQRGLATTAAVRGPCTGCRTGGAPVFTALPQGIFNPSEALVLLGTRCPCRDRPGSAWALAGLPEPSQGSPGRPRHRGRRPPSPEERATPSARTGAAQLSLLMHGVRAAESPVPVGRLLTPLRLVGPFGRSNGPCEGQRAVPMPARLMRRLSWPGVQAGRRDA